MTIEKGQSEVLEGVMRLVQHRNALRRSLVATTGCLRANLVGITAPDCDRSVLRIAEKVLEEVGQED